MYTTINVESKFQRMTRSFHKKTPFHLFYYYVHFICIISLYYSIDHNSRRRLTRALPLSSSNRRLCEFLAGHRYLCLHVGACDHMFGGRSRPGD